MKTAKGLIEYAKAQLGRPYWYGTFGQQGSEALHTNRKRTYPTYYTANDFKGQYGQKVHDCVGLIKGYMWTASADDMKPVYKANGMGDVSANMLYNQSKHKGTMAQGMPDIAGVAVFMAGHVGIYIGNGEVIEARGHAYGVVKTKLKSRPWSKWAFLDFIDY